MLKESTCAWAQQHTATAAASACGVTMARIVVFVLRLPRGVTEGPTLLPPARSDKRTKGVFAVSRERISSRSGRGFDRAMTGVDSALSGEWMAWSATIANLVTVLVLNRYYSICYNRLFLPRSQGKRPAPNLGRTAEFRRIG